VGFNVLNEGLRPGDLRNTISPLFEIDAFSSKMGDDADVCVVSFQAIDRAPARDLMEFFEKSYNFVLDADVSAGENDAGEYTVFIELSRIPALIDHIQTIAVGVKKLTNISDLQFRYHKNKDTVTVSRDALIDAVPVTKNQYNQKMIKIRTEQVKEFFNITPMHDLILEGDVVTIIKPLGQKIQLQIVDENTTNAILENYTDPESADVQAMSEVFWLTKVLGDYKINKIGENFLFDSNGKAMLFKRV